MTDASDGPAAAEGPEGGLLRDITVLDVSQIYNGPYATFLMAMAGARVIKVEPPSGEPLRKRAQLGGAALPFAMLNANKKGVVLDLKAPDGKADFLRLAAEADVLVENFTPGVMERLELGPAELRAHNPRLVYARGSGYGQSGRYRDYPAMDLTIQAMGGIMSVTGYPDKPPVKAGPAVSDFLAGIHLYGGIVTALYDRERTGRGRTVEVSMLDSVYASLSSNLGLLKDGTRRDALRTGNRHGGLAEAPYNVYRSANGHVAIICVGEEQWQRLLAIMERPDLAEDARFASLKDRVAHIDLVDEAVEAFTSRHTSGALFELLGSRRITCAPVRTLHEVMNDPHMHETGMLTWFDHPDLGRIVLCRSPISYEGEDRMPPVASPRLGEHTAEILGDRTRKVAP